MAKSVNRVTLLGNLGKDAETKFTPAGQARTTFTLATSRRWKDQQTGDWKEETDWHSCVVWRAENLANYLLKGKQVYVEGRLQTRSWDKDGQKHYMTEVVCEAQNIVLLGGGGGGGRGDAPGEGGEYERPVSMPRSARPAQQTPSAPADDYGQGITDDDVPF